MSQPTRVNELGQACGVCHRMPRHGVLTRLARQTCALICVSNEAPYGSGELLLGILTYDTQALPFQQAVGIHLQADHRNFPHPRLNECVGEAFVAARVDEDVAARARLAGCWP